uniref:C2H2-type domain-containing protein n=1 Tax=Rhizophora mucronata TaxID=61149 RepID=A0A2P2LAL4_RHIMU
MRTYAKHSIDLVRYEEHDYDPGEVIFSQVGTQRLNTTAGAGRTSFAHGANKPHPSSTSRLVRPLSPSRISAERPLAPEIDDFAPGISPRRFVEGASPSCAVFDYGPSRAIGKDEETTEWRRKHYSDDNRNRFETSIAYSLSNGHDLERPRALIDAYGDDRGKRIPTGKSMHVERLDVKGMGSKMASRSWQNTEEEEFDWEDMSPTLIDRNRNNDFLTSSISSHGSIRPRPVFERPVRGLTGKVTGFQTEGNQIAISRHRPEAWSSPHNLPQSAALPTVSRRGRDLQSSLSASSISSTAETLIPSADKIPDSDEKPVRPSTVLPSSSALWPPLNVNKSYPPSMHPVLTPQKETMIQLDQINADNAVSSQGYRKSAVMFEQQLNSFESKQPSLMKQPPLLNQNDASSQQNLAQINLLQSQFPPFHDARERFPSSVTPSVPPYPLVPPSSHRYSARGLSTNISMVPLTTVPAVQLPVSVNPNTLNPLVTIRPPLPPSLPPALQMLPIPQSAGPVVPNQQPGGPFSGLINSLMAQGLISVSKQTPAQDSIGLEFDADLLKVRHESAISALYAELPRQCTTCGLRFKCQEEHSSHMDWHVTKNRMSKNRKQNPSRKWFVSASMWLSGAEALGSEAVPGFLPTENDVEKKDDEEMAVPAEEEQTACALCGEPFDDFYSDETEEWMYKGAVYLNAPSGSTVGMDRSQLGPIVHAKCRSDSSVVPPENFGLTEGVCSLISIN